MICLETKNRRIEATSVEFQVQRKRTAKKDSNKRKKGEIYWQPYKYCRFLDNALKILHQEALGASDAEGASEAASVAQEECSRLVSLIDVKFTTPRIEACDMEKQYGEIA